MKVLIIDDEPAHVRGIMKYVKWEKLGYDTVTGVYTAKEALKRLDADEYDLVVTDINMPEINGLNLIEQIHNRGKNPDIIIVSGYNEFSYAQEAIRLGVKAYILKPIKPEEIEENISIINEKKGSSIAEQTLVRAIEPSEDNGQIIADEKIKAMHPVVQKILLYIGKNYEEAISLQMVAEANRINESYLSALFKQETGLTFSNYLMRFRMSKAMELLKYSDMRVNEVAYRVGYQNPCYFTEQFKKIYDITPSDIRK